MTNNVNKDLPLSNEADGVPSVTNQELETASGGGRGSFLRKIGDVGKVFGKETVQNDSFVSGFSSSSSVTRDAGSVVHPTNTNISVSSTSSVDVATSSIGVGADLAKTTSGGKFGKGVATGVGAGFIANELIHNNSGEEET